MSVSDPSEPKGKSPDRRKLIAVVYADMVGYSRLIGHDDVGTLERLRTLRSTLIDPSIAEYGGRIVNTGGDSLLLVFASVEAAVRCAMKVQLQAPDHDGDEPPDRAIRFRVVINFGDVIPDGTDVHGDVVNVAARLQAECPPGGICVSRAVRDHVQDRLNLIFEDRGALKLKNISRPVEAFVLRLDTAAIMLKSVDRSLVHDTRKALPLPGKPSIAVLAFTNMSGDLDQEYFSDGITDDIITELSRSHSLFVIARSSSFTYKKRAVNVKQVANELGVRYVVEGSVRRSGSSIRVTAQLIDAETGNHLWAERYDRALEDVFAVQDDITSEVTTAILPAVADAERRRASRKAPETLDVWELYHRGLWHLFKFTPEDNRLALEFLHKAAALDPDTAAVHAALAWSYFLGGWMFAPQERATWFASGLKHGRIAVSSDPLDAIGHAVFGMCLMGSGEREMAIMETTRAVSLNSNSAIAQGGHGSVLTYSGRSMDALPHLAQAIRLSPFDPVRWVWLHWSASAHYFHGDYESCAAAARELCRMREDAVFGYRALVVALAELGRIDEARQCADIIHRRFNGEMRAFLTTRWPEWRDADYSAYVASLAKGGLVLRDGVLTLVN
jgi:adenylate cyclase